MARILTKKQRKFVNAYADSGIGNQAVIKAGYEVTSDESARAIASQNLTNGQIQDALMLLGFDSNNAKRVIAEILNDDTNEPKDRLSAADKVLKVHGDYAPEKVLNLNANMDLTPTEDLKELADGLLRQQKQA